MSREGSLDKTEQERYAALLQSELSRFDLPFVERTAWLYKELAPRVACDILAYTPREWETMKKRPFVRDAMQKGVVLYEKELS